jgi:hypothetical protein
VAGASDSDGGLRHTGSDGVGVGVDAPATPHWNGCERQRPVGEIQLGGERLPQHHTRLAPRQSSWSYVAGIAAHNDGGGGAQNLHTTATVVVCAPPLGSGHGLHRREKGPLHHRWYHAAREGCECGWCGAGGRGRAVLSTARARAERALVRGVTRGGALPATSHE